MRWAYMFILFAFASVAVAAPGRSVWGQGGCAGVPSVEPERYEWAVSRGNTDQVDLYRNGLPIGSWFVEEGAYYPLAGKGWGAKAVPPVEVPIQYVEQRPWQRDYKFGVDPDCCTHGENYSISGRPSTRQEVIKALMTSPSDGLTDDSTLRHLTCIGKDRETADKLRSTFGGLLRRPGLKEFRVQVYDASRVVDQLMLAPFKLNEDDRFQRTGSVIYVQRPEHAGKGAVQLALYGEQSIDSVLDGLRKVDPTFDPQRNPPGKPKLPPAQPKVEPSQPSEVNVAPLLFAGALAAGAGMFIKRR